MTTDVVRLRFVIFYLTVTTPQKPCLTCDVLDIAMSLKETDEVVIRCENICLPTVSPQLLMTKHHGRNDSSVGIVIRLRIRQPGFDFQHWAGFFLLPTKRTPSSARSRGTAVLFKMSKTVGA
jgi:hypothetical protein